MSTLSIILILALAWQLWHIFIKGRGGMHLGKPPGRLVSADPSSGRNVPSSAMFSKKHRLRGTPDYVHEDPPGFLSILASKLLGWQPPPMAYLPVEVKSAAVRFRNYKEADKFQLMEYCFLLQEKGLKVKRGRLKYANTYFDFPYGSAERQEVMRVLEEVRRAEKVNDLQCFAPAQDGKCRGCEFRMVCSM